jgi:hypothetical protein
MSLLLFFKGGGVALTLDAEAGAYSLTGQDATLNLVRALPSDAGSYSVVGQDATLASFKYLSADAGSYSVVGQDATLALFKYLSADAGSYSVVGQDATLASFKYLSADAGSYSVVGQDATLASSLYLSADAGSYSVVGQDATLLFPRVISADGGAYSIVGQDATLVFASPNVRPNSDITTTGWTPSTGSVLYEMIDEAVPSDADWINSPDVVSSPGPAVFGLSGAVVTGPVDIKIRARRVATVGQIRVLLQDGSGTTVGTSSWQSLTDTFTTYTLSVTTTGTTARARLEVQS